MNTDKNTEIIVRPAKAAEWEIIATFQVKMALETENVKLEESVINSGVVAVFSNPVFGRYYVAVTGKEIIASLLVTYEWSDWRNSMVWWLQSVYVLPEYRRKGVFSRMYHHIRNEVENLPDVSGIRLYMIHHNQKAEKVYLKIGMDGNRYRMFEWMKNQ
ncbi:MAG: N-acetyltransferase [Sphingobacteriia bacterium]|nr:N-acetyltransferase [Sphingobacteriia bacterium]